MMNNTLSVSVSSKRNATNEWYEGTVSIAGLVPSKLARRTDGSTQFNSRSALSGAARNLAKSLGFSGVQVTDVAPKKTASKRVATSSRKS